MPVPKTDFSGNDAIPGGLLQEMVQAFSVCKSFRETVDEVFRFMSHVFQNSRISVVVEQQPPETQQTLHYNKQSQTMWETLKKDERWYDALLTDVFKERKGMYVFRRSLCSNTSSAAELDADSFLKSLKISSFLAVPLLYQRHVQGILVVGHEEGDLHAPTSPFERAFYYRITELSAFALAQSLYVESLENTVRQKESELTKNELLLEKMNETLKNKDHEREQIMNSSGEGIIGLDLNGVITFSNLAASVMMGYEDIHDLIGKRYEQIFHNVQLNCRIQYEQDGVSLDRSLPFVKPEHCPQSDEIYHEIFYKKDGASFPVEYVSNVIKQNGELSGFVVTFRDITLKKELEEKVRFHVQYDSLTRLPKRVFIYDHLKMELQEARKNQHYLALMTLDLDRFQLINDMWGRSSGDDILRQVAQRLKSCLRERDTIFRQGGDEFTIIIPDIEKENEIETAAQQILRGFEHPFSVNQTDIHLTTSIGISVFPYDGTDEEGMLRHAETALHRSKELMGNHFHFYTSNMGVQSMDRVKMENQLYKALERREFLLHYQPQIHAETGQLMGLEALIRWKNPNMGFIPPGKFIPLAEETGMILPIGQWVLKEACAQMQRWQNRGFSLNRMSINLSGRQFKQNNLVSMIETVVNDVSLDPRHLVLELTENNIIQDSEATIKKMQTLKDIGIQISIDDFGTGYSSLAYLKSFPIDHLKIDKSFIRDIDRNEKDAAITSTIITLAHNLGLSVIAEGVETIEQLDFVRKQNCDWIQGYFFSPPLSAQDVEKRFLRPR